MNMMTSKEHKASPISAIMAFKIRRFRFSSRSAVSGYSSGIRLSGAINFGSRILISWSMDFTVFGFAEPVSDELKII